MASLAIETEGLTKRFGDVLAVDSVDLRVNAGEVYGFLGLNGAGKTTTIRALLGMIRPSAGNVKVLGQDLGPNGRGPWGKVGHLVESPAAYPELTVRENLEIARRLHDLTDPTVVSNIMEQLRLGSYVDRAAGTLSMGNLQRLGLARALMHEPQVLILDEPANGLDPAGVVEIRELLMKLAREKGVTVFMSSHILGEVNKLATRIGIIHHGKLIRELSAAQLEASRRRWLEVRARNFDGAFISMRSAGFKPVIDDATIHIESEYAINNPDEVARILGNAGTPPTHLAVKQEGLEEYFLRLTGGSE